MFTVMKLNNRQMKQLLEKNSYNPSRISSSFRVWITIAGKYLARDDSVKRICKIIICQKFRVYEIEIYEGLPGFMHCVLWNGASQFSKHQINNIVH